MAANSLLVECRVNTHSAPDAVDLSRIVTLISHNYVKSRRHTIYEHEACAKVISDWVRSQLGAQRALDILTTRCGSSPP
jgi:hypothetical protein